MPPICLAILAALGTPGCGHSSAEAEPIEDGTVLTLTNADELMFSDAIGSATETTSGDGVAKGSSAVFPYGFTRYDSAGDVTRKYANTPRDGGVGLDQMGMRAYAPELGVWTSADPVAVTDPNRTVRASPSATAYAYANSNPIVLVDADGRFAGVGAGAALITKVAAAPAAAGAVAGAPAAVGTGAVLAPVAVGVGVFAITFTATWKTLDGIVKWARPDVIEEVWEPKAPLIPRTKTEVRTDTFGKHQPGPDTDAKMPTCPAPKIVKISESKYPESAAHIRAASKTHGSVCTADRLGADLRRSHSLAGIPTKPGLDRDEYPPALCKEGGFGASVRHISSSDNQAAGASFGNQMRSVPDGCQAIIKVVP